MEKHLKRGNGYDQHRKLELDPPEKNTRMKNDELETVEQSFLLQTLKGIWEQLRKNQESQVRSWEKTCGLGATQKKHR